MPDNTEFDTSSYDLAALNELTNIQLHVPCSQIVLTFPDHDKEVWDVRLIALDIISARRALRRILSNGS